MLPLCAESGVPSLRAEQCSPAVVGVEVAEANAQRGEHLRASSGRAGAVLAQRRVGAGVKPPPLLSCAAAPPSRTCCSSNRCSSMCHLFCCAYGTACGPGGWLKTCWRYSRRPDPPPPPLGNPPPGRAIEFLLVKRWVVLDRAPWRRSKARTVHGGVQHSCGQQQQQRATHHLFRDTSALLRQAPRRASDFIRGPSMTRSAR